MESGKSVSLHFKKHVHVSEILLQTDLVASHDILPHWIGKSHKTTNPKIFKRLSLFVIHSFFIQILLSIL